MYQLLNKHTRGDSKDTDMIKPHVLILSGYGLNCEEETKFAFDTAGGNASIVHINDIIDKRQSLSKYQIIAFPGGFSYGDDTGSGNAYANRVRNHLWNSIRHFIQQDKLVIGICNGFQILVNLGLLPALDGAYGERQVALLPNVQARYIDRWVDLKTEGNSPWVIGMSTFQAPIAHGEGNFFSTDILLKRLKEKRMIAVRYVHGTICRMHNLKANPNGSSDDIAGITDESGKIFGLMPHPERAIFFTQLPHWPAVKTTCMYQGVDVPSNGPGIKIFENGISYFC